MLWMFIYDFRQKKQNKTKTKTKTEQKQTSKLAGHMHIIRKRKVIPEIHREH